MSHDPCSPRDEYVRRLDAARDEAASTDRRDAKIANARLALFVAALALGWLVFYAQIASAWWLFVPAAAFLVLIVAHDRVAKANERASRRIAIYERGLARVEDRWAGLGPDGARFATAAHRYAADLDLFGTGSLFQRITTARTRAGEKRLADWLLSPADQETILARQRAVADLRSRLDLLEDLAHIGETTDPALDAQALVSWCEAGETFPIRPVQALAAILAIVNTSALAGWLFLGLSDRATLILLVLSGLIAWGLARRCGRMIEAIHRKADDRGMLAGPLGRMERETCVAPGLIALQEALKTHGLPASRAIASLRKSVDLLDWQRNLIFAPFALAWLWGTQVALRIESWRRLWGRDVAGWVDAAAEFEAIASLASYSFENPEDPFPEILDTGPIVEAERMGHPLLPKLTCIRNDVSLGGGRRVLIVSGSNMSGKSTLLRSLGSNVVLALAGAPVKATRMTLSPVAIGATLRIQDSLQEGKSRFYAEILRLRQVVDLSSGDLPLLFLLDEILHGTNSHDRLEGASAIVRGLIDRHAIGLVTTHDLALAAVAQTLAPRAENVHFEDHFEDGVMRFDYLMRPGVVRKSNALALMRAVGLDV